MNIVSLDLGSHMAIAHNVCEGVVISDSFLAKGLRAHRLAQTMKWLRGRFTEIKKAGKVDLVTYERPFARGMDATRSGWGIAGLIEALATEIFECAVTDTDPQTIKKFSTGNSRAEKDEMIEAAQRMGYVGYCEHEADAYCLLKYSEGSATVLPAKAKRKK